MSLALTNSDSVVLHVFSICFAENENVIVAPVNNRTKFNMTSWDMAKKSFEKVFNDEKKSLADQMNTIVLLSDRFDCVKLNLDNEMNVLLSIFQKKVRIFSATKIKFFILFCCKSKKYFEQKTFY